MAMPSRAEVEAAFEKYLDVGAYRRDWNAWADLFTEDAVYIEVQYGTFHGREAIRNWITTVMAGVPDMYFPPPTWRLIDGDQVCFCIDNAYPNPKDPKRTADRVPDRHLPEVPRRPVVSRGGHLRRARQPRGARRVPRRRRQRRAGDGARMTGFNLADCFDVVADDLSPSARRWSRARGA